EAGPLRIGLDLQPNAANGRLDRLGARRRVVAPDLAQELVGVRHMVAATEKIGHQRTLRRSERGVGPVQVDGVVGVGHGGTLHRGALVTWMTIPPRDCRSPTALATERREVSP